MSLTMVLAPAGLSLLACACVLLVRGLRQGRRGMVFSAGGIALLLSAAGAVMMEFITRPL